ncbi:hypothetical protein J4E89_001153 [Alternaria sp. Ai002NY15]|nr:hypothetical protein J4E89_001153 [Alternaria sp. Ai002NY15]
MSPQTDDVVPQSPSGPGLPPNPFLEESTPPRKTSRVLIDLSSPPKSSSRTSRKEARSEMARPRQHVTQRSEDEKRLIGDYSPADAISMPDPSTWMPIPKKRTMPTKPGSSNVFKPVDTIQGGSKKPTTYGKRDRTQPPLIGQAHGPGQAAYLQRTDRAPATTPRRPSSSESQDRWSSGATPGKRRRTANVISLVDDDDEVVEVSQNHQNTPVCTSRERPRSAWSLHSQISNGSESTVGDYKPPQATSEFREVDNLLRPSQKKPRNSSFNTAKGGARRSPLTGGSLSTSPGVHTPRQAILQTFRQGESKRSPRKYDGAERKVDIVTSRYFPEARINESTSDHADQNQRVTVEDEDLRTQHKPVPKQAGPMTDNYSADELAITPPHPGTRLVSKQKQKQTANSGVKRNARGRVVEGLWPLSFARSYGFQSHGSTTMDGHAILLLRWRKDEGLRVQTWESVDGVYDSKLVIEPKDVNQVYADGTSRMRLTGPRGHDGNKLILDLEFADTADFLIFRDEHAVSMTSGGKCINKSDDYMTHLFKTPLPSRNEKVGTSALVGDSTASFEQPHREKANGVSKRPLLDQLKPAVRQHVIDAESGTTTTSRASTRPSRSTRSAPINYVEDTPTQSDVPKFSVETGLGQPWAKSLEFGEGRQRAIVHFDDLPRLDEEEFLNDSLIDFYMIYLFKQLKVPADKVYFFNTYFFTKLTENSGRKSMDYKAVQRWTSKIDIFTYDYIVVPINEQAHWYLAIICNMSKVQRKPIVQDFDEPQVIPHDQASDSAVTATNPETHATMVHKSTSPEPNVINEEATAAQTNDEEPMLFDEAALSLVDRDDTGTETPHKSETTQADSTSQNPDTEALAEIRDTHAGILSQSQFTASSAKKKAKRKPIAKRDPDQPVIIVLDSLGGNARTGAVRALKDWIAAEGASRRAMEAVIKENGYYPKSTQVPMQNNFTDCGVYLLGYIEKFFQNPDDFKNKLLTGSMSAQEDWPELNPSEMRHKMRQIIFDCYKKQEDDRRAQKKAKKGSASSKTSPAPTTYKASDLGRHNSDELSSEEPKLALSPKNAGAQPTSPRTHSPSHPPLRLASPFSFDAKHTSAVEEAPQIAVSKVSDSPPVLTFPAKQAVGSPRSETTPRRHSPEVRISSRTPQSHDSLRNGHITSNRTPRQSKENDQTSQIPGTSSPKKRRRHGDDSDDMKSPSAKRQLIKSPQRHQDGDMESKQRASRSREGSVPDAPIEIKDSQEVKVINVNHRQQVQAAPTAQRKPASCYAHSSEGLRPSPTFEEIPRLSYSTKTSKHGQHEGTPVDSALQTKLDEDDYARDKARRSEAPAPSNIDGALERREEVCDPMEGISQSTHELQLDGVNDGSVVQETPEPEEKSTTVQTGWSRDNPTLL